MTEATRTVSADRDVDLEGALRRLDTFRVERVLADKPGFTTELAARRTMDGSTEYVVLKHIGRTFANAELWAHYREAVGAHLPRLLDTLEFPDEYVLVLQYIPGESLDAHMARLGVPDLETARSIMIDLCDAASALADVGIVHRDIKPSNVVLSFDGAYLIDPGIARVSDATGAGDRRDQDTTVLGSWGYAAPEQLGFAETDARSDVFSLGRLLGYLLTGLPPTDPAYMDALRDTRRVPENLRVVVTRACALEPSVRPANALALKRLLMVESQVEVEPLPQGRLDVSKRSPRAPRIANSATGRLPWAPSATSIPAVRGRRAVAPGMPLSLVVLALLFTGFFGTLLCVMGFFVESPSLPRWGNVLYGFIMGVFGNFLPGYELLRAYRGLGPYAEAPSPAKMAGIRIIICWAIGFGLLVFTTGLARATGWPAAS